MIGSRITTNRVQRYGANARGWPSLGLAMVAVLLLTGPARGQDGPRPGVEERLGRTVPLDELTFTDEQGRQVRLSELVDRPIVLTLVYFRCPGICTPLLNELTKVADECDLKPGEDYRMITVSFDPKDTAELAAGKKKNMLELFKRHQVPPDGWRFLVGDQENITRLTGEVGFGYVPDTNKVDFVHPATLILLSPQGKIVRYLGGSSADGSSWQFGAVDLKMAVIDASQGRPVATIHRVARLCFSYDPASQRYVLNVNRIILGVAALVAAVFVVYLLRQGRRRKQAIALRQAGDAGDGPNAQTEGNQAS